MNNFYTFATTQINMNIKLRKLRESRNVSQDAMASLLNISQPQYYRKECNLSKFTKEEWQKIADFLDTEMTNILDDNLETNLNLYQRDSISELLIVELKEHIITLKEIIKTQKEEISILRWRK